jgi:DNA invertase Pin-like site-specific DNA recombinase
MRQAAGYIRRSSVSSDSPGDASREAQDAAIRGLQALHAKDADLHVFTDWGISGRRDDRPQYVALKAAIAADQVCCVFAYSLSRLGRSNGELDAFFRLCAEHDVTVYTKAEGALGKTSAMGGFLLTVMSAMAELESELAKERSAEAKKARLERGDAFGLPRYGYRSARVDGRLVHVRDEAIDLDAIRRAYLTAGSVLGACTILEDDKVPAPNGGERWSTSMVTRTIEREWPELLPSRRPSTGKRKGHRSPASAALAGLLRCPFCTDTVRMLTPNINRGQYYCSHGPRSRATHPRYAVREADILPALMAEASRYRAPIEAVEAEGIEARQAVIAARLDRANELYMSGDIDRDRFAVEKSKADRDIADLRGRASVATLHPVIDWDVAPDVINGALRSIWREVRLDENLRPVDVEWTFPELRA